jgi:hypothetical protein
MNKFLKRVLIITGIIIAVLILAFGEIGLKFKNEFSKLNPMETGRI